MNLINIENITKYYTDTPLFEQASFTVDESEKIGIIGINGTGKTTLLKMLVGMEEPDSGSVTRANNIVVHLFVLLLLFFLFLIKFIEHI